MPIFKQEEKKNSVVYKTKYSPERLKRFKEEGVTLRLNNQTLKLKESKEIIKKTLSKPKLSVFNINNSQIGINFSINEIPEKVYVDFKEINRHSNNWKNIAIFNSIKPNKETTVILNRSLGQAFKVRVTYLKEGTLSFEDRIYEDKTFKFFFDPPEIVIHKRNNIVLKVFNVERFAKEGYIRIFKKENQEEEKCIFSSLLSNEVFVFEDDNVNNHNIYEYRAEIYDNQGNVYNTLSKKILYQKLINAKPIEVQFDEKSNMYRFPNKPLLSFKIEKYNLKTEKVEIINFIEKENQILFSIGEAFQDCLVHIESYDQSNNLAGWGEILRESENSFNIINAAVLRNSLFQNIIKWNYQGNVDTFIVTMKNSQRKKVLETKPHRIPDMGYAYCVDDNFSKERIYTEYIINAINEFGTIIGRKRLVTQWKTLQA